MASSSDLKYLRDRAEREIALAQATGAKAQASPDFRNVFVTRRDGSTETIHLRAPERRVAQ